MNPAYSVIFLTTLIGAGQGLFLALFGADLAGVARVDGGRSFCSAAACGPAADRLRAGVLVLPPRPA
jgi:hypothetical protein